ncbi:hypothetical protein BGX29_006745 [Mortierella sp. GBA35]|nr:hypothetical protein BGX29_006745 [Mortierella sp. GBA35]
MEHCLVNIVGDPEATDSVNSVIVPVDDNNDDTIIPTDPTPSPAIATMNNNSNDATTSSSQDVSSTPNEPGPGGTIAEGSDEGTIAAGTAPSHGPRWFLKPTKLGIPVINGPMLECTADEQPPVAIEATTRYTQWKMDLRDLPPGDYDLALAVSVQGPMLAKIKSLVLTFHDDLTYIPPNNIIFSGDYLRTLLSQQAEVGATTLKVDAQIQVPVDAERASEPSEYTAVLEIRMLSKDIKDGVQVVEEGDQNLDEGDQSLDDGNLGQLYLHHVQLRRFRPASGLSGAVSRTSICLDVWDLRGVDSYSDDGSLNENIPSTPCASLIADLDLEFRNALHTQCDVSISSDGSWISLLDATTLTPLMPGADATTLSLKSVCGIFKFDKESLGPSNLFTPLCRPSINSTHVAELAAYSGYGKFTSLDTTQLRPQDELFVACNGREAKVYSVYQQWSHLRTIQLTSPPATLMEKNIGNQYRLFFGARRLIGSLRGPVFAWTGNADYMVTVYHAGTGSVISAFKSKPYTTEDIVQYAPVEFSRDGLSLAIYGNGIIARHSVATGALLGTFDIPSWVRSVFTLQFIKGDSQILVEAPSKHDSYGAGRLGIVIDAASMSLAAHFLMPGGRIICQGPANRQDSASFYSTRCSKLYLTTMDSCIIDPYTRPEDQCYSRCLSDLTPLGQCPEEFTSPSGLTFRLEIRTTPSRFEGMTQVSPSVVVSIASAQQPIPREAFVIPPMEHKTGPQLGYQCELLKAYEEGDDRFRGAVLDYIGAQMNDFPVPIDPTANLVCSRWRFWRSSSKSLLEYKDPILQVDLIAGKPNPKNDTFSLPLFEARFDMLWAFKDQGPIGTPFQPTRRNVLQQLIHWVWVFICMAFHKLWLKSTPYVQSHHFSLDAYENRALEALIEYKWNTIGYRYWLIRFLAQLCYYALILSVVILQITNDGFKELRGLCYFIIASSVVFLWLELVQFFREKGKYTSSLYNVVDLLTFTLPLAASTYHLLLVEGKIAEEDENIGLFSFSILFIALHFLFELRVNKSVCYIVTIIIRAINKIRVFFFIFAFGIITFSTASLHSLRGCYYKSCTQKTIFPSNFYGAFVTVYFLMGGRYDQISDEMNSNNWTFQTLMIVFFFFTVILMLNVLIALINKAFNDGDETWRLVWLENRLRIVEAAEDMSFRIPGFRASHNWFPEVIYYSATHQQVRAFEEKFFGGEDEFLVTGEKGWAEEDRHRPTPLVLMAPTVPVNYSVSQFPSASAKQQTTQELLGDTAGSVLPTIVEATTSGEDLLLQLQQQLQAQEAQNRRMEEKLETLLTIFMNLNPAAPVDVTTTPTMTTTTK